MSSWETLHSVSVGGVASHVTELAAALQQRANQLGVAHATRFLGQHNGQDLVNLPSRNEPFGITALEGWAASKPVVASKNGGPNEFVWHDVTGLKIDPSIDSIGWGLGTRFTNFDWARWMGRNGRVAAEQTFTWEKTADSVVQCYQS
jgi:glycosyltransferase involved in cell wall biosynthesis